MRLYRPTGLVELQLVARAGFRRWPPRLPEQPIFYPVLTEEYARKIARDWNTVDEASGFIGFVTRFELEDEFAERYPVQVAGGDSHLELWVPAEELEAFNDRIVGRIEVVETFTSPRFSGPVPAELLPTPDRRAR